MEMCTKDSILMENQKDKESISGVQVVIIVEHFKMD